MGRGLYSAANSTAQWDYYNLLTTSAYRTAWVASMLDKCEALGDAPPPCAANPPQLRVGPGVGQGPTV